MATNITCRPPDLVTVTPAQRALSRPSLSPPRLSRCLAARAVLCGIFATATAAPAQTFTVLHHFDLFTQGGGPTASEALTLVGDTLYGVTSNGGLNGVGGSTGIGTLFSVKTDGTGFAVVHAFPTLTEGLNTEGSAPACTLKFAGGKLYGTTTKGGTLGNGILFSVNPNGTAFTPLFNFSGIGPTLGYGLHAPVGDMALSGDVLYGVTARGGSPAYDGSVNGRIFAVTTSGAGTIPYAFPDSTWDGAHLYSPYGPYGGVALLNNKLYGITISGGYDDHGTVFAVNTDGSGYTTLHRFTKVDGALPLGRLVASGDTLYGTTASGGTDDRGVVYSIKSNGSDFTVLRMLNTPNGTQSGLIVSGDTLYGSTSYGGTPGWGTVFSMKTDGTQYTTLHGFDRNPDGYSPSRLILSGDNLTLYGMTGGGGQHGYGTVFRLTLPPPPVPLPALAITRSGNNLTLTWPAADAGWTLQTSASLDAPLLWLPVSPGPVVIDGKNSVTTSPSGPRRYYRLSR